MSLGLFRAWFGVVAMSLAGISSIAVTLVHHYRSLVLWSFTACLCPQATLLCNDTIARSSVRRSCPE